MRFLRRKDKTKAKRKSRFPSAIPQRWQWTGLLLGSALIISAGLSYQVVFTALGPWEYTWRAILSALIITVSAYIGYRRLR